MSENRELARQELTHAADLLRQALDLMNRHGDALGRRIAVQADGFPYGEVYDGLSALVKELWPTDGPRALAIMIDGDVEADRARYLAAHERLDRALDRMEEYAATDGPDPVEYHEARDEAIGILTEHPDPGLASYAEGYIPT